MLDYEDQLNNTEEFSERTESEIESDVKKIEKEAKREHCDASSLTGLAGYIRDIRRYHFLSKEEQDEIWKDRTKSNLERLINSHLRLVIDIVNDFMPYNYRNESDFMDLVQAGNMGLMHAADIFDPTRNVKFITHAHYWIRAYVRNEMNNLRCGAIRKPNHILAAFSTITQVEERLEQILDKTPTEDDLKVALDGIFPDDKVDELLRMKSSSILSLDMQNSGDEEDGTLMDCISDNSTEEKIERDAVKQAVNQGISEALDPRLALIITARFGLGEFRDDPKTLEEIAKLLKDRGFNDTIISKERIRQLEERALGLLKENPTILSLIS